MGLPKLDRMTIDEFLIWQVRQDKLYELVDGLPKVLPKAMAGASSRHDRVVVNAIAWFRQQLRGKPCRPTTADIAVQVRQKTGLRRPDMTIECGKPHDKDMVAAEPRVVLEVLSPSTIDYDRFQKLEEYKQTDTVDVILLADTERPIVMVHRRTGTAWIYEVYETLSDVIPLPEIGIDAPMAELFDALTFEQA